MNYKTLLELAAILDRKIHDVITGTTTSNGAADGTTLIDTSLVNRFGQPFVPLLVEITSGARDGQLRPTGAFEVVSGDPTLTVRYAFTGQIVSGVTYKLHSFLPSEKKAHFNDALRLLPEWVPYKLSEVLIAGELLRNSQLQFWRDGSTPYDWDIIAGTVARSAVTAESRRYTLSLTGSGSAGAVQQRIPHIRQLAGVSLTFSAYVYGTADAGVVLRVFQNATSQDSDALTATNTWTKLSRTFTVADSLEPLFVELRNTSAGAILFRDAHLLISTGSNTLWIPRSDIYRGIGNVEVGSKSSDGKSVVAGDEAARMPEFYADGYGWYPDAARSGYGLPTGYFVRLTGDGHYPTLSADTDEIEIEEDAAQLLATLAGLNLMRHTAKAGEHMAQKKHWAEVEADLEGELARTGSIVKRQRPSSRQPTWR